MQPLVCRQNPIGLTLALLGLLTLPVVATAQTAGTQEIVLEGLNYGNEAEAQGAWHPSERTAPVRLVREDGTVALEVALPFASQPAWPRSVHDRRVSLDLSRPGEFLVEVLVEPVEAVGYISLYFRSGEGWYAASGSVTRPGRQVLRFRKSDFRTEERPQGWHQIDGIRISFWRGQNLDGRARIYRLVAVRHAIAILGPAAAIYGRDPEYRTARETLQRFARLLDDLGLEYDEWDDASPNPQIWAEQKVIIVPYHPRLTPDATKALAEAIRQGTRVFLNYQAPAELLGLLGIGKTRWVGQQFPGQFAEVRFDRQILPDLPEVMRQSSWNVTEAEPAAADAQVIGWWYTASGEATRKPAMILSPRGAFFSHILLDGDTENQRLMLAAVLSALLPELKTEITRGLLTRAVQVGHLTSLDELRAWLKTYLPDSTHPAWQSFAEAEQSLLAVREAQSQGKAPSINLRELQQLRGKLIQAYLSAQPSPHVEGRAYWNHSGLGAYPGDWERTARELSEAGFNMVLPNMLWAGLAHYASDILPRSEAFQEYGDQIEQCVAACHRHGLEVHVWKVNFNLSNAPQLFMDQMRAAGRTQMTRRGEPSNWLCPSHPENQRLEVETMLEVVRKYPVDGIHFDYIRYPGPDNCFCPGCRQRFEAEMGVKVAQWPDDCVSGPLRSQYLEWRRRNITRVVEAVSREARQIRPGIKISAAVFAEYPACRDSVGQDWVSWVHAGYLDFVCPMDYTNNHEQFVRWVKNQWQATQGKIPMYPGIGAYRLDGPDQVVAQIALARLAGVPGFTIFNLDEQSPKTIFPAVKMGATRTPATPPHRTQR